MQRYQRVLSSTRFTTRRRDSRKAAAGFGFGFDSGFVALQVHHFKEYLLFILLEYCLLCLSCSFHHVTDFPSGLVFVPPLPFVPLYSLQWHPRYITCTLAPHNTSLSHPRVSRVFISIETECPSILLAVFSFYCR